MNTTLKSSTPHSVIGILSESIFTTIYLKCNGPSIARCFSLLLDNAYGSHHSSTAFDSVGASTVIGMWDCSDASAGSVLVNSTCTSTHPSVEFIGQVRYFLHQLHLMYYYILFSYLHYISNINDCVFVSPPVANKNTQYLYV